MTDYTGVERRSDEFASLREHIDLVIATQTKGFNDRLHEQRVHFDSRIDDLHDTVRPVLDVYTTATVGASILKWAIGILVAIGGLVISYLGFVKHRV